MQAPGIGAVHALILAHEPLDRAVGILVLVELDEVPEMRPCLWHGLVSVVECRRGEWHVVPLDARYFTRLATDTRCGVDKLADFEIALHAKTRRGSAMARDHHGL
jgi:hypothetical protein